MKIKNKHNKQYKLMNLKLKDYKIIRIAQKKKSKK